MGVTEGQDNRDTTQRVRVERRIKIRRMQMRRTWTRRFSIVNVDEERRYFNIRRMSKRRAISRRHDDRRRGIDRMCQAKAERPLEKYKHKTPQ